MLKTLYRTERKWTSNIWAWGSSFQWFIGVIGGSTRANRPNQSSHVFQKWVIMVIDFKSLLQKLSQTKMQISYWYDRALYNLLNIWWEIFNSRIIWYLIYINSFIPLWIFNEKKTLHKSIYSLGCNIFLWLIYGGFSSSNINPNTFSRQDYLII